MALSEKHRSELYTYFEPRLGGDVTEAMLREFPKGSGDELVTREYLDLRFEAFEGRIIGRLTSLILGTATVVIAAVAIATTIILAAN
jgi:hypothetical protein